MAKANANVCITGNTSPTAPASGGQLASTLPARSQTTKYSSALFFNTIGSTPTDVQSHPSFVTILLPEASPSTGCVSSIRMR